MRPLAILLILVTLPAALGAQEAPRSSSVRVVVNPRIELMSVVQLLSGYALVTRYESPYTGDAQRHFAPFSAHPAAIMFREMSEAGFAFSHVPTAMLSLTEPPALEPRVYFEPLMLQAAGGEEQLLIFAEALRDFVKQSRFLAFFDAHRDTYAAMAEHSWPAVQQARAVLEEYTGTPLQNSTVVLGPLLHDGGFAARYRPESGPAEAYAFIGPSRGVSNDLPEFGGSARLLQQVGHEFAHLVVDPVTSVHDPLVQRHSSLYDPIADVMRRNAYPRWETVVNEHIIRAITTRLAFRERGEEAGRQELTRELQRGYVHLPALLGRLEEYEQNRGQYPTIEEFYARPFSVFTEALAEHASQPRPRGGPEIR
jgi:hypothetical protein